MPATSRAIDAPTPTVWQVLVDTRRWPAWGPTVAGATLDGGGHVIGPGATGRVRTAVGLSLPFEITEWHEGRRWAWRVAGRRATAHTVEAHVDGGSLATIEVPWWAGAYLVVCWEGLRRIEALVA